MSVVVVVDAAAVVVDVAGDWWLLWLLVFASLVGGVMWFGE